MLTKRSTVAIEGYAEERGITLYGPCWFEDPRILVESFLQAGFIGGIADSVAANAGLIGGFISCSAGGALGLILPAMLIDSAMPRDK